jgi:hypothetical protein
MRTRSKMTAVCLSALLAGAFSLSVVPAEAAKRVVKKQRVTHVAQVQRHVQRPRTRITVQRRSFLDPGTEVLPGEEKSTDYVFPPGYSPTQVIDNTAFSHREPLPGPFDLPGRNNPYIY